MPVPNLRGRPSLICFFHVPKTIKQIPSSLVNRATFWGNYPPGVRSAHHSGPSQLCGDPQRQKRGGHAWWAPTRRLEKCISNLDMRHGTCPDFQPSLLVDDGHWWPSFKRSKQVNVQMCHEGLWSSSICLKLVRWTPFRRLLWAHCPGWAALTMGPQVRWVDLGHHKIRTSIGFRYQNLGWSIDELSHNSKVMQAKAPSMYSITSKQKYHEQVLSIESSRIQWQCCIWSWIELESVLLSFQFYKWNGMRCFELTVNWLEAFSQVAEKLSHQPHCPLQKSSRKPGLWTIRTNTTD